MNDSHNHISYSKTLFASDYTFDAFLHDKSPAIEKHIVFLNPIYKSLYSCEDGHRYSVIDLPDNKNIAFACNDCFNVSHVGADPYRADNERLLIDCENQKNIIPYLYLTLSNNTMHDELEFFEKNYSGKFFGIKAHPNLCSRKLSEIDFNSKYPMIVHAGMNEYDDPENIVKFAENYDGNVLVAHFARCDIKALKSIAKLKNTYIDVSPLYLATDITLGKNKDRYFPSALTKSKDITEFFNKLISIVGEDKIIFGSDTPWGTQKDVEVLYHSLKLPEKTKEKIFKTNFEAFNKNKTKIKTSYGTEPSFQ